MDRPFGPDAAQARPELLAHRQVHLRLRQFQDLQTRIFLGGPFYLDEFRRKVSNSPSTLNSYQATWRKLERYVRQMDYD